MAVEDSSDLVDLSLSADSFSLRLREALDACSRSIEADGAFRLDEAVAPVISLLLSLVEPCTTGSDETMPDVRSSEEALDEIYRFVSSYSNLMVVEALSLELPKLLVSFAPLSDKCGELSGRITEHLVTICSPREMLSVLCEALASETHDSKELGYQGHILFALAKVLLRIQRRHFEQIKVVLPIVLGVLDVASSGITEEDKDSLNDLFSAAISIGSSIREICLSMKGQLKEVLRAVLSLYILQNIALVSRIEQRHVIQFSSLLVAKLLEFLPFCGLSYCGLLTGSDFDGVNNKICKEADDEFTDCFSRTVEGACLAVIWGHISSNVSKAAGEKLEVVFGDIRHDRSKIWQAVGTFKHVLASIEYPWIIKSYGIDVLLNVMNGNFSEDYNGLDEDFSSFMPNLFTSLKALEMIMIGAPEASLRKKAYRALRMVVSVIPCPQRFDILKALISKSNSPSMIAIFIDLVKAEILVDNSTQSSRKEQKRKKISPFCGSNALDVVEMILRPSQGGPPSLPEHSEPVLSALNLYRFLFIIELTGKTNNSGVLSEGSLRKAYSEWLMPLRTLISGMLAENEGDGSELAESISCALSPVQLVLYRCIELVEEAFQPHPTSASNSVP